MSKTEWRVGVAGLGTVGGGLLNFLSDRPDFAPAGARAVVTAVSAMIFSIVSAADSTGAVQVMSPTVRKRTDTSSTVSPGFAGVSGVTGTRAPPRRTIGRVWAK